MKEVLFGRRGGGCHEVMYKPVLRLSAAKEEGTTYRWVKCRCESARGTDVRRRASEEREEGSCARAAQEMLVDTERRVASLREILDALVPPSIARR